MYHDRRWRKAWLRSLMRSAPVRKVALAADERIEDHMRRVCATLLGIETSDFYSSRISHDLRR